MFVEERQSIIMDLLRDDGKVLVKELSARFGVSDDLIRKDLTVLENRGLLRKTYGGAVLRQTTVHREETLHRKEIYAKEKRVIAKQAFPLIPQGSIIFLDISSTNIEIAKIIAREKKQVTVVTNMIEIMRILSVCSQIKLIFIGGELNYDRDGFVGGMAIEMLDKFCFDVCFVGAVGIDSRTNAVYTHTVEDGLTKALVMANSQISYLVCEKDKFIQIGSYKYAQLDSFTGVITDEKPNVEITNMLNQFNTKLIAEPIKVGV